MKKILFIAALLIGMTVSAQLNITPSAEISYGSGIDGGENSIKSNKLSVYGVMTVPVKGFDLGIGAGADFRNKDDLQGLFDNFNTIPVFARVGYTLNNFMFTVDAGHLFYNNSANFDGGDINIDLKGKLHTAINVGYNVFSNNSFDIYPFISYSYQTMEMSMKVYYGYEYKSPSKASDYGSGYLDISETVDLSNINFGVRFKFK